MASTRPVRIIQPSSKLSAENGGDIELTFHRKAIAAASKTLTPLKSLVPVSQSSLPSTSTPEWFMSTPSPSHPSSPTHDGVVSAESTNIDIDGDGDADNTPLPSNRKCLHIIESESDDPKSRATPSSSQARKKYKKRKAAGKCQFL
jgi:hypothetical protein